MIKFRFHLVNIATDRYMCRLKLAFCSFVLLFKISSSSEMRSIIKFSSYSTSIIPLPSGSYLLQTLAKASKQSWLNLTFYSVAEAWNPSRIIAMNKLRKTRLTMRKNDTK